MKNVVKWLKDEPNKQNWAVNVEIERLIAKTVDNGSLYIVELENGVKKELNGKNWLNLNIVENGWK